MVQAPSRSRYPVKPSWSATSSVSACGWWQALRMATCSLTHWRRWKNLPRWFYWIVMRRSNGVAVLEALRKDPRWASLPIYAMTSNVERVAEYKRVGFWGLVGKPFDKSKLQSVVRHMTTGQADDAQLTGGFS